jgi:hypothetical protein
MNDVWSLDFESERVRCQTYLTVIISIPSIVCPRSLLDDKSDRFPIFEYRYLNRRLNLCALLFVKVQHSEAINASSISYDLYIIT